LPVFICIFFYFGEGFFVLYKQKERRKVQKYVWSILQTTPAYSLKTNNRTRWESCFIYWTHLYTIYM